MSAGRRVVFFILCAAALAGFFLPFLTVKVADDRHNADIINTHRVFVDVYEEYGLELDYWYYDENQNGMDPEEIREWLAGKVFFYFMGPAAYYASAVMLVISAVFFSKGASCLTSVLSVVFLAIAGIFMCQIINGMANVLASAEIGPLITADNPRELVDIVIGTGFWVSSIALFGAALVRLFWVRPKQAE